jgi:hypothetical protein
MVSMVGTCVVLSIKGHTATFSEQVYDVSSKPAIPRLVVEPFFVNLERGQILVDIGTDDARTEPYLLYLPWSYR